MLLQDNNCLQLIDTRPYGMRCAPYRNHTPSCLNLTIIKNINKESTLTHQLSQQISLDTMDQCSAISGNNLPFAAHRVSI
jgi:hypothetical protein